MDSSVIAVIITGVTTVLCNVLTVFGGNKLIAYRIEQLEKKVEKHNGVIERTALLEEKMKVSEHRIADLEELTHERN